MSSQYPVKNSRFLKNSYALPRRTAASPAGGEMRLTVRNAAVLSIKSSFCRSRYVWAPGERLPLLRSLLDALLASGKLSVLIAFHSSTGGKKPASGIMSSGEESGIT